ncbi:related to Peregrin (Bromodomain and PHD finger-containing protein 1) [Ustilago bromivora]|uniref:Related to Peregrin (Bromodomain and PHD finger-containing protein 1) n=1 Tax=Ustilago bromivora TaxID=307758 RepID=A0A1K0GDL1_9BASI|nr:related to Peregrin (Bromodomain and PHD finger-containing protein 1) [Ustilago bromivora]SYW80399.1 related to Peregrin (Bromodomain and PHD finger-containing protein 1) [Ustilago bromivora]
MPGIPSKPNNIPLASSLPKVSFRKVPPDEALLFSIPPGIVDPHALPFGYNDGSEFDKPDHYIRYVEPIEGELKKQVEYDMDEQDQEWLDALNYDRRKEGLDTISYEIFEIIFDQLEKEWFGLMKRVPPKARHGAGADAAGADYQDADSEDGEDSKCAICDDGECENSNAIVFCDGCNLAVHQDCYGIPYIPEGQWLCRKCTVSPDRAVSCILCPHEGGAFKQTTTGKWAHLLCAMWIPETGVSNPVYMEPIDSIERIPKARWKLQCYLCRYRMGACIQCDNRSCFTAFHVTCARQAGLLFRTERTRMAHHLYEDLDNSDDEGAEVLRACCHRHMPADMRDQFKIDFSRPGALDDDRSETHYRASPFARTREHSVESGFGAPLISVSRRSSIVGAPEGAAASNNDARSSSKSARAYKKSFKPGPPLVPAYIANRVLEYITKIHLRKKTTAVQLIARYWSLKREARRGAPLLKRLHLEPWTASSSNKEQTEAQKAKKLHFLRSIRGDLERVRMLVEQVRKREKEKLRQAQEIRNSLVEPVFFPFHADLRAAISKFEAVDRYGFFAQPVSKVDVPDYYDIVKEPMDWSAIKDKIANKVYDSVEEMRQDVLKIATNAMTYNKADTPYHKAATKILKMIPDLFKQLAAIESSHLHVQQDKVQRQSKEAQQQDEDADGETQVQTSSAVLSDETPRLLLELGLEPPSDLISLLQNYSKMEDEEQLDMRQQAYDPHPLPPSVHVKGEEDGHAVGEGAEERAAQPASSRKRLATPVVNLMEDFVQQIYVPPRPPASTPASPPGKAKEQASNAAGAAGSPQKAQKTARKRKTLDAPPREPAERRSTRRSAAADASPEPKASTATVEPVAATPVRITRRAQSHVSTISTASGPTAEADGTDAKSGAKPPQSTAMSKSLSTPAAAKPKDGVQLKEDVGAHDSFLLFNTGWVLPPGSKRHRNAAARPEMIGQRPRKVSAPESPGPSAVAAAAAASLAVEQQATPSTPQQRPRSHTVPSPNSRPRSTSSMKGKQPQSSARKATRATRQVKDEGQGGEGGETAGSSPLTSDDEGDKPVKGEADAEEAEEINGNGNGREPRSSKRAREREASQGSESKSEAEARDTPSALLRRSARVRTASAEPPTSPSNAKRPRLNPSPSSSSSIGHEADFGSSPPANGTKVWAKVDTFPYFPAVAYTDEKLIPGDILRKRPDIEDVVAVEFYGRPKTWGWVTRTKLAPLFADESMDEKYLRLAAKKGRTKQVKEAYEDALSRT